MSVTDDIKERLDIVEVISSYVPLKKAGRNYQGLCPFHSEKTPSFVVFPDSQNWHCFGACGTGGDIFTFIMKRENLDFAEALKLLAARAGVELQPRSGPEPGEQHLERLREVVASAATYFHYLLVNAGEARVAREYLERRGLVPGIWESWQLGYSPNSWDALIAHLTRQGYALADLESTGLVIRREESGPAEREPGYYDRFRGRLMIPIRDVQGRTIGFGGRILIEDQERPQPKYINSPQTELFDKSNVLYGLDMARKAIREANLAVIVEGYMDVLMSHQVGVRNVVAGMGTALTEAQLRQLKRYTSNMTLALDPDAAGDKATLRGLDTARQALQREWGLVLGSHGLLRQENRLKAQLRIATLPDGLDPDELARADPARWRSVIASAQPVVDYYLGVVSREEDLKSAHGKAAAVARLAPLIHEIASPVERGHYVQLLARTVQTDERLVAQEVEAAGRSAREELRRAATPRRPEPAGQAGAEPDGAALPGDADARTRIGRQAGGPRRASSDPRLKLEQYLLGRLLLQPELLPRLDAEMIACQSAPLGEEDLSGGEHRAILVALQAGLTADAEWSVDGTLAQLPEALRDVGRELADLALAAPSLPDERLVKDMGDSLLRLRGRSLQQQVSQLQFLIMDGEQSGEHEQLRGYHDLMVIYTAQKRHIQTLLNARTITGALKKPAGTGAANQA